MAETEDGDAGEASVDGHLAAQVLALAQCLRRSAAPCDVLGSFHASVQLIGASSATFLSFICDDALLVSYRCVHVGHPAWPVEYASHEWFTDDPWLAYALHESEPILARDIEPRSPRQQEFVRQAGRLGYASALIAPAPSPQGQSRVGVLCLGREGARASEPWHGASPLLARTLAMEMHAWMHRSTRAELLRRSRIAAHEIELLRHEFAGRGSKAIASLMHLEAKTIDSRFQRACAKLGVPNRRAAVRMALLYGLL